MLSSSVTEIYDFASLLKPKVKLNVDWELSVDKMVHKPQSCSNRVTEESQKQGK